MDSPPRKIVIVGGGIIGCTTAYYLSHHPSFRTDIDEITILEASTIGVAQGASGKAGGLVAKWAYPRELVSVSFPEHVRLAELHNGAEHWGWRYVNCGSWEGHGEDTHSGSGVSDGSTTTSLEKTARLEGFDQIQRQEKGLPDDLRWVEESLTDFYSPIAGDGDTAQVHPYLFTTSMLQLAQSKGVKLRLGAIAGSIAIDERKVTGVSYQSPTAPMEFAPATHAILCAGPWTPTILPSVPVKAARAHSIVIRPQPDVQISPYVLFTKIERIGAKYASPEIYARPENQVYACGPGDNSPLPYLVDHVQVDDAACEVVFQHVASISPELRAGTVVKKQACFVPTVEKGGLGGPIIGPAPRMAKGYYIAAGHTCWVSIPPTIIAKRGLTSSRYRCHLENLLEQSCGAETACQM